MKICKGTGLWYKITMSSPVDARPNVGTTSCCAWSSFWPKHDLVLYCFQYFPLGWCWWRSPGNLRVLKITSRSRLGVLFRKWLFNWPMWIYEKDTQVEDGIKHDVLKYYVCEKRREWREVEDVLPESLASPTQPLKVNSSGQLID